MRERVNARVCKQSSGVVFNASISHNYIPQCMQRLSPWPRDPRTSCSRDLGAESSGLWFGGRCSHFLGHVDRLGTLAMQIHSSTFVRLFAVELNPTRSVCVNEHISALLACKLFKR